MRKKLCAHCGPLRYIDAGIQAQACASCAPRHYDQTEAAKVREIRARGKSRTLRAVENLLEIEAKKSERLFKIERRKSKALQDLLISITPQMSKLEITQRVLVEEELTWTQRIQILDALIVDKK